MRNDCIYAGKIWHDTYTNVLMPVEVDTGGGVVEEGGAVDD